jgi:hypothetical protein
MTIKLRSLRWAVHVACIRVMRNTYKILVGKPRGKKPTRRSGQTGLFKKMYTLSRIYFTSTIEHMAMCYI